MPRTPREVSESYWDAECRRDIDAVLEHYHPDGVYEDAGGRHEGLEAIRRAYEASARAYPGLEVTIVGDVTAGPRGALEFVATLVDAAGVRSVIRGVNLVEVHDGRFRSVRSYEDPPRPI
jgi:ketosteroid isomerase-like protein